MNKQANDWGDRSNDRPQLHSSLTLLERARAGDRAALEALIARYLPRLQRWASGRLPRWARDIADTQDVVQEAVFQTFKRIERFESRGEGALQAYLRQAILNRMREELRRAKRRPARTELDSAAEVSGRSPLEEAIGQEAVDRYERALARLRPEERELVVARIELGYTNREIAELLDKPTSNAARMADGARHRQARQGDGKAEDMMQNERVLHDVAGAMVDGVPVDWAAAESSADDESMRRIVRELKVIAAIADVHGARALSSDNEPIDAEPRYIDSAQDEAAGSVSPERTLQTWGSLGLLERVGEGAFGTVYRAWDGRLDREVALKLLRQRNWSHARDASVVIHEGRMLAQVRHPNVVTVYGADRIAGRVGSGWIYPRPNAGTTPARARTVWSRRGDADWLGRLPRALRGASSEAPASGRKDAQCHTRGRWANRPDGFWDWTRPHVRVGSRSQRPRRDAAVPSA
jgi:RNA polymerase sigma-70 factor (ECF subfamily)